MASVLVPVAYVIIIFGGLFIFSFFYRKHTSTMAFEPYFPSHPERNAYVTLLQQSDPPAHDALLKSALVRRAMADVQRVLRIREDKPALQNLLQKGSIGDDLWNSLLAAEKELEAEIMEVVAEANSFVEGWGQVIFPTANEMLANEKIRAAFERTNELKAEFEAKYEQKASKAIADIPGKLVSNGILSSSGTGSAATSDNEGSVNSKSGKKTKKRK
ncbi:translocation protein sec66 [Pholiota molesta]|nr:translocation protein sec66 [Pholiota molesta]